MTNEEVSTQNHWPPDILPPGTLVRGLEIRRVLGRGVATITYEALRRQDSWAQAPSRVVVTELFPCGIVERQGGRVVPVGGSHGTELFAWVLPRFAAECRMTMQHKNSVMVETHDFFEANGTGYQVSEYAEGPTLRAWLRNLGRSPTQREIDDIALLLVDALGHHHGRRMLHGTLDPENIVIRSNGLPMMIEVGRRTLRDCARWLKLQSDRIGDTDPYCAIEQQTEPSTRRSRNLEEGPWTDIYRLSAILYEAITGDRPLPAIARCGGYELKCCAIVAREIYDPDFLRAIDSGLCVAPGDRPQSMHLWHEMLFGDRYRILAD